MVQLIGRRPSWLLRGYTQTYGVDYKETFDFVAKMNTVRVILFVALNIEWPLRQPDLKNAFLRSNIWILPQDLHQNDSRNAADSRSGSYNLRPNSTFSLALYTIGTCKTEMDTIFHVCIAKRTISFAINSSFLQLKMRHQSVTTSPPKADFYFWRYFKPPNSMPTTDHVKMSSIRNLSPPKADFLLLEVATGQMPADDQCGNLQNLAL